MAIILCLMPCMVALFALVMPIIFSVLVQDLTSLTVVKQMHVVDSLGTEEQHSDLMNLHRLCPLAPSWSPENIKHKHAYKQ